MRTDLIPTRHSLLGRLKDWQDQESWREFVDTYKSLVHSVAIKAGLTQAEAEDAVQETFVSVAKTMPKFQYDPSACSFKTWLHHLARKRIVDQLRKRPRFIEKIHPMETHRDNAADEIPDPASLNLDAIWDEEWHHILLEHAMRAVKEKVNPRQYQMFYLYAIKQLPIKEVARSLRANVGQVYLAKHRISAMIKKQIEALEGDLI